MAYFANSTDGEILDKQCGDCPLGAGWHDPRQRKLFEVEHEMRPCPVALVQLTYNYDQCDNPKLKDAMDLLISEHGSCRVRLQLDNIRREAE